MAKDGESGFSQRGGGYAVTAVTFSPDGRFALSAIADETIQVWEMATGDLVRTVGTSRIEKYTSGGDIAVSPDGRLMGATFEDGFHLWEVATWEKLRTFRGKSVSSLAFSPNGRKIVAGSVFQVKILELFPQSEGKIRD